MIALYENIWLKKGVRAMRNPWPMAAVLMCSALLCVVWDVYFAMKHLWLPVVVLIGLVVLWGLVYARYSAWCMEAQHRVVMRYQANHQLKALENGFERLRPWATREMRNAMRMYWALALMEQRRWREAREVLLDFRGHCVSIYEWMDYYFLLAEYAEAVGNGELAAQAKGRGVSLKEVIESGAEHQRPRATKGQCRRAFFAWLSLDLVLFGGSIVAVLVQPSALVTDMAAGAFVVGLFIAPVTLGWGILWWMRPTEDLIDEMEGW